MDNNKKDLFIELVNKIPTPYGKWTDNWLDKFFKIEKEVFGETPTKEEEVFIAKVFCED